MYFRECPLQRQLALTGSLLMQDKGLHAYREDPIYGRM